MQLSLLSRHVGRAVDKSTVTRARRLFMQRGFLKLMLAAAAGAGASQLSGPRPAGATTTVADNLLVQGNLTTQAGAGPGYVGVLTASPQAALDVNGAIAVSGTTVIGTDGVIKKTYYAP